MKVLFLTPTSQEKYSGINKKVFSQYEALKNNHLDVELCYLERKEKYNIARKIYEKNINLRSLKTNNKWRNKFYNLYLRWNYNDVYRYIIANNISCIYIRYEYASNYGFIKFLKKIKEKKIKILIEIPTYPYDNELLNGTFKYKLKIIIDKYFRKNLKNYIDRIITFSEEDNIYGVKTIKISNGIDLETIKLINKNKRENLDEINFIGVAGISFWHGFDRMILSIFEYYKVNPEQIIKFHIVGNGDKKLMNELRKIVQKNKLEKYVIFHGKLEGEQLDKVYRIADIAIGSLGRHRSGIRVMKALKNREYAAKGIPMIFSEVDLDFEGQDFVYKVKSDDSTINIFEIIEWYKNLKITSEEIREFSKQFSWDIQMKKVVDKINKI